jgi:hypothetical protein
LTNIRIILININLFKNNIYQYQVLQEWRAELLHIKFNKIGGKHLISIRKRKKIVANQASLDKIICY